MKKVAEFKDNLDTLMMISRLRLNSNPNHTISQKNEVLSGSIFRKVSVQFSDVIVEGEISLEDGVSEKIEEMCDNVILHMSAISEVLTEKRHLDITDKMKELCYKMIGALEFIEEGRYFRDRKTACKFLIEYK